MHQSKKGNEWHFGMKAHIGVDAASGLVHTVVGTAGNVSDVAQAHALLHGDETAALGEAGYQGVEKRPENVGKAVTWHEAMLVRRRMTPTTLTLLARAEQQFWKVRGMERTGWWSS
jgi:IS5 family transposase